MIEEMSHLVLLMFETCFHGSCRSKTLTATMGVSPPHSSGSSPFSLISCFTLSMLAPSLSICSRTLTHENSTGSQ